MPMACDAKADEIPNLQAVEVAFSEYHLPSAIERNKSYGFDSNGNVASDGENLTIGEILNRITGAF